MSRNSQELIINNYLGDEAVALFNILLMQKPKKADAIILLQGDRLDRVKIVQSLYKNNFARQIVVTGNNELIGRGKRNEENDIHLSKLRDYFLSHKIPEENIILDDRALNTLEQAVNVIKLAKEKGWLKLIVVTSPYHILRAYLALVRQIMEQAWQGRIIMQAADLPWSAVPSGREKTAAEMFVVEIEKIKNYKKDIATIKEGIKYI